MKSKLETRRRVQMEKLEFYEAVETFDEIETGLHRVRGRPGGTALPGLHHRRAAHAREVRIVPHVPARLPAQRAGREGRRLPLLRRRDVPRVRRVRLAVPRAGDQPRGPLRSGDDAARRAHPLRARLRHHAGLRVRLHTQPAGAARPTSARSRSRACCASPRRPRSRRCSPAPRVSPSWAASRRTAATRTPARSWRAGPRRSGRPCISWAWTRH